MFLRENRDGKIKGRTMSEKNKQRIFISKEDCSSLTVETESVIFSCTVNAKEEIYGAIIDTPNAIIQIRVKNKNEMTDIDIIKCFS